MHGLESALNTTIVGLVVYLGCFTAHTVYSQWSSGLSRYLEEELVQARRAVELRGA